MAMPSVMGWLIVAAAVGLPWLTWFSLSPTPTVHMVVETPLWLFVLLGLSLPLTWVWAQDRWLGVLGAIPLLWAIPNVHPTGFEVAYVMILGSLGIVAVRQLPVTTHRRIIQTFVLMGALQVAYVLVQWSGRDPLWWGWDYRDFVLPKGTLGNQTFVGTYLAVLTPLAPLWMIPVFLVGIGVTKCAMGLVAALVGVGARYRWSWRGWLGMVAGIALLLPLYPHVWESLRVRGVIWGRMLRFDPWWVALIGHGPGAWIDRAPVYEGEIFLQAHNEYLQWGFEAGLLGVLGVAGWVWYHQDTLRRSPYRGAVSALAVMSLTMFPFHLAITGLLAVVVLGLATREGATDALV